MGRCDDKARNAEGQMVVDFATRMEMVVLSTYFKKTEEPTVTFTSGGRSTYFKKTEEPTVTYTSGGRSTYFKKTEEPTVTYTIGGRSSYFKKSEEPTGTYTSGGRSTLVDYILGRRVYLREIGLAK